MKKKIILLIGFVVILALLGSFMITIFNPKKEPDVDISVSIIEDSNENIAGIGFGENENQTNSNTSSKEETTSNTSSQQPSDFSKENNADLSDISTFIKVAKAEHTEQKTENNVKTLRKVTALTYDPDMPEITEDNITTLDAYIVNLTRLKSSASERHR